MTDQQAPDITRLLHEWNNGREDAKDDLLPFVYDELKRQARILMYGERRDHTLQPTALVHEAFLRLSEANGFVWQDRSHFFGIAARVMRNVLVDHARGLATSKRGGGAIHFSADEIQIPVEERAEAILLLSDALDRLATVNARQARVVEMRFFAGMDNQQIGDVLKVTDRTINRDWKLARLWLYHELNQK